MPSIVEYTMIALPGKYDELIDSYIEFADRFGEVNPTEDLILITGDPEAGLIRGIGLFESGGEAHQVYGAELFVAFRDHASHLIAGEPTRSERELVHVYVKG
ncbi:MAG: hypothetical protein F2842_07780 [Actinobacteria bacterium]|uniref:Unannotated protein n=1 Tax=freshwater metagenome TaxID=449393 RepID=A0A6J7KCD3_9ZZZZ|nr:hypothetical protein [Actinomycetota bacterium]MSW42092.1 hypothetical protein [Actinomycetota bacterium]